MNGQRPGGPGAGASAQAFQTIEADAVCERCGTVNDEGSLMCKACGQNLREQRARRLSGSHGSEVPTEGINRVRLLTGLLSALGILIIVLTVLNLGSIEAGLVSVLSDDQSVSAASADFWSGTNAAIYEELASDLRDYPTSRQDMQNALDNPAAETSYNGRYILLREGALDANRVVGEAALRRRGNRVHFVAFVGRPAVEVRGYAVFEEVALEGAEGTTEIPVVRNTAGFISEGGKEIRGFGSSEPQDGGGHVVFAFSGGTSPDQADQRYELYAYRIR